MAPGNIFTLIINDGRQDALLTATARLTARISVIFDKRVQKCMAEQAKYFADPKNAKDPGFQKNLLAWTADPENYCSNKSQALHNTINEIRKTHNMYIGACYKPFVPIAYSYIKTNEKKGTQDFGGTMEYVIPQLGTWFQEMVLHVQITGLSAVNAADKLSSVRYPGTVF